MKQHSAEQSTQLPSLRIAYRNNEIGPEKRKRSKKSKGVQNDRKEVKEPLPLFDDYKFKAKDYDPL